MDSEIRDIILKIREELGMTLYQIGDIVSVILFDPHYDSVVVSVLKNDAGIFYLVIVNGIHSEKGYELDALGMRPPNFSDLKEGLYIWLGKESIKFLQFADNEVNVYLRKISFNH